MPTVAPLDLDGYCISAMFLDDIPHFALADGTVHRLDRGHKSVTAHDGLLVAAPSVDASAMLTGGEDGRICLVAADGNIKEISNLENKWVSAVACGPGGSCAWASGRTGWVRLRDGTVKEFSELRSIEALSFAPKGIRIAAACYDGVTLHWAATSGNPVNLEWKGAHTGVTFSPGGDYVVTAMQENALHGWRLSDGKHMRMSGYPAKIKSLSWSAKGKWLASSGAPAAIVWPFSGKDGPMGKAPVELGTRGDQLVTCVGFHPTDPVVAIGYSDGMILAARPADSKEVLLRRGGRDAVSSMAWDLGGTRLVFGSEAGDCGVVDITG